MSPTTYTTGRKRHNYPSDRKRRWDRERCVAALRDWYERYGEVPRYEHWHPGSERYDERHRGAYPSAPVVLRYIAPSWPDAMKAAGLQPLPAHEPWPAEPRTCGHCGCAFTRRPGEPRHSFLQRVYCSLDCQREHAGLPFRERIEGVVAMALAGSTVGEIAEAFGMTSYTVSGLLSRQRKRGVVIPRAPYPKNPARRST